MTIILSLETSTEIASVSLFTPDALLSVELQGVQTHSFGIIPAIQSLLNQAQIELAQCDAIAFGCGPGAFTGVRTACGVVQGLAFGLDIPVVPIVSLLAMAQAEYADDQNNTDFLCVLDARMAEVYWAHYRYADNAWLEVSAPQLSTIDVSIEYVQKFTQSIQNTPQLTVTFVLGNGVDASSFKNGERIQWKMPKAHEVAQLGLVEFKNNRFTQAQNAQPLYLRNKVALTSLERAQENSKK